MGVVEIGSILWYLWIRKYGVGKMEVILSLGFIYRGNTALHIKDLTKAGMMLNNYSTVCALPWQSAYGYAKRSIERGEFML